MEKILISVSLESNKSIILEMMASEFTLDFEEYHTYTYTTTRKTGERERENPLPHFTGIKPLFQAYAESIQEFMLPAGMQEVLQGEKNGVKKS